MKTLALNEFTTGLLAEIAAVEHESTQPAVWHALAQHELSPKDRAAVGSVQEHLLYYKTQRVNEATIWARAIYPLLMLAETDRIRAWSGVALSGSFGGVEVRGEADGALAQSLDEEIGVPYLVVVEAKRGMQIKDPMAQLLAAVLCAAQMSGSRREMFGCYTIADVWTFLRLMLDWGGERPRLVVQASREYTEKTEAETILSILKAILAKG